MQVSIVLNLGNIKQEVIYSENSAKALNSLREKYISDEKKKLSFITQFTLTSQRKIISIIGEQMSILAVIMKDSEPLAARKGGSFNEKEYYVKYGIMESFVIKYERLWRIFCPEWRL